VWCYPTARQGIVGHTFFTGSGYDHISNGSEEQ